LGTIIRTWVLYPEMKYLSVLLLFFLLSDFQVAGQNVAKIDSDDLLEILGRKNDTTYVVNFWATWCSPCVKEIGFFEELYQESQAKNIEVFLVSLDFPDRADKQLLPFLREKYIEAPVLLMTDLDYNSWIDQVDHGWSGAIPATLIYNRSVRIFLEQELTRDELFSYVNQINN